MALFICGMLVGALLTGAFFVYRFVRTIARESKTGPIK